MTFGPKALTVHDLPMELFHLVLDQLGCHDRDAIAACTLVCRDWLDASRHHLFSEIRVVRGRNESFEDLAQFLETHQTLAGFIRILSLESRLFSIPPRESLMTTLSIDLIYRIVCALPNPNTLRLRQLRILPGPSDDSSAPVPQQTRFHFAHMEYDNCLSEVIHTFTFLSLFRIEHLDFIPIFADDECQDVKAGERPLDVRSLCVHPDTAKPHVTVEALRQVVPPNMLRSFRYSSEVAFTLPPPVTTLLRDVGQNIVDLSYNPAHKDDHLLLPLMPNLQVFRYYSDAPLITLPAKLEKQKALLSPFLDDWLPHLSGRLEGLVLYIPYGEDLPPSPESMPLWGLETVLARFRRLMKLGVCFPEGSGTIESALTATAVCFPRSSARGILDVSVREWELECREWDIYGYLRDY